MENKSNLNTVLLVIIIILLAIGLGYFLLNNSKGKENTDLVNNTQEKEDTNLENNPPQESSNNKVVETNKKITPTPAPEKNPENNLVSITSDPYISNMTSSGPRTGALSYYLIKKDISLDNLMNYYHIYSDIYSSEIIGKSYIKDGKIYYNPIEQNVTVKFGNEASGDVVSFRENVNKEIALKGYAIVVYFSDGGPNYINYTLEK